MPTKPTILWFRQDLRLSDQPALAAALRRHAPVVPIYIWDPQGEGSWPMGAAGRWWLHQSLRALDRDLHRVGSRLLLRQGDSALVLKSLIQELHADAVFWNRCYEPAILARDQKIEVTLRREGITVEHFTGSLLYEPGTLKTKAGKPYQVFTPFWKSILAGSEPASPLASPKKIFSPARRPSSEPLVSWKLEPEIPWDAGFSSVWTPGEAGAHQQLRRFLQSFVPGYKVSRDHPDEAGTSRLSPHLHFGEISPREIWAVVQKRAAQSRHQGFLKGAEFYLREVAWREFAYHLLFHFPNTLREPLRPAFKNFPWRPNPAGLKAWKKGRTGYPLVDAGLRELWTTGWMHNRVRMIVGSFLVKDLLIDWRTGARWFWDTLVDADLANNTLGWQWIAGCGADAAPYFRIFNPMGQGERFDALGGYTRRWIPELAKIPAKWLHRPWQAPADVLKKAGVTLGQTYPFPCVDHAAAREQALIALSHIRKAKTDTR